MLRDPILAAIAACIIASASRPCPAQAVPQEVEVIETRLYRSPDEKVPDLKAVADDLVARANAFRKREKKPPVAVDAKLAETARYFAEYMARTDRFGHAADGHDPGIRAAAFGYEFGLIAENIAYAFHTDGFTTGTLGKQLDEGWKDSPGHRANMLDPDVTETGMAVARSERTGYYYAVQLFARPSSKSVVVEIVNRTDATLSYRFAGQPYTLPSIDGRIHEQGRPTELIVEITDGGKPAPRSFPVGAGKSRFVISEDKGALRINKE